MARPAGRGAAADAAQGRPLRPGHDLQTRSRTVRYFQLVWPRRPLWSGNAPGAAFRYAVAAGAPAVVLFSADSKPDLRAPRSIRADQPVTILREMDLGDLGVEPVLQAALSLV